MTRVGRRTLLRGAAAAAAVAAWPGVAAARSESAARARAEPRRILYAVKYGMVAVDLPMAERFRLLKELGYDGVELESPAPYGVDEVRAAIEASGLPVHGVVDSVHWDQRLSHPDPAVRARGVAALEGAVRDARAFGGSSVLLVPGRVADPEHENEEQVRERSIEGVRAVLPAAAELGVRILVENVWNGFAYDPEGGADQTAGRLAAYLDAIGSPWVGAYFDLGNHQRYGRPAEWIRTLGARIVKLDVKDWGAEAGFCKIGDGDVDWPAVRAALAEIRFTGWATAEVAAGDREHLADVLARMRRALEG